MRKRGDLIALICISFSCLSLWIVHCGGGGGEGEKDVTEVKGGMRRRLVGGGGGEGGRERDRNV